MFSAASNVDIAGGSFSIREAPQAHASVVVNMPGTQLSAVVN